MREGSGHPWIIVSPRCLTATKLRLSGEWAAAFYRSRRTNHFRGKGRRFRLKITGGLNNPIIYDRFANGVTVAQLVTDFGRTHELVKSSTLHAHENVVTSCASVILAVDQAYFAVLKAQSVLQVAQETVKNRQIVVNQISAMARSQLKSDLDIALASGHIVNSRAPFGGGPINTFDSNTVASFVPTGVSGSNNGRGVQVIGNNVYYTELSNQLGPTAFIRIARYNDRAGAPDIRLPKRIQRA